jgi:glycerophosphoryl diester phosphodiesterase
MVHPYLLATASPRVFAHRGLLTPALAFDGVAENSLAAVRAAVEAGVGFVESDCHLTSDGVVVLFHDDDLRRVTGDPRMVAAVTHRELRGLMAQRGELLTLEHALEQFPATRFNIDVKSDEVAEPAGVLLGAHGARVLLTSFSDARRRRAREAAVQSGSQLLPAASPGRALLTRILFAVASRSQTLVNRALTGLDALQIPERYGAVRVLSPRLIEMSHRAGVEVHVWTVNDAAEMQRLVSDGVDGIITDRADLALETLSKG